MRGGEGGKKRAGMMWAGVHINACFVAAYVYRGDLTVQVD